MSDAPSGLLLLNGTWLLLLSINTKSLLNLALIATGSSIIGLAAWIRSFYFYPLLASLVIGIISFLFLRRDRKKTAYLLVLLALFFPGVQVLHTYKVTKKVAYMNTTASNAWTDIHLNSKEIGYDTVLPALPMYSQPSYCNINTGLLPSLKAGEYSSLACLLFNRALFYLSTYEHVTYINTYKPKNKLYGADAEDIGSDHSWLVHGLDIQWDVARNPQGNINAEKFTKTTISKHDDAYLVQWASLPRATEYTFSLWLWADQPGDMEIAFSHHGYRSVIARKIVSVTTQPQRFSVSGKTQDTNDYSVSIGNMPFTNDRAEKPAMPSPFYAWGAQLEAGPAMTGYVGQEKPDSETLRPKYPLLLTANVTAILAALLFLVRIRQELLSDPIHLVAISLMIFSFAQALVIIPEQRFAAVPMTFIWLIAIAWLASSLEKRAAST